MFHLLRTKMSSPLITNNHLSTTTSMATTTAAAAAAAAAPSLTLHFLEKSCSLSPAAALSISKKIHLKTTKKAHAVLSLLKSHSFTTTSISTLISRQPKILLADAEKTLKPKLQYFSSLNLPDLPSLLSSNPDLLSFSLHKRILPNLDILAAILPQLAPADAVTNYASCLVADLTVLLPTMKTLQENGVPMPVFLKLLTTRPRSLSSRDKVEEALSVTRDEMGVSPSSRMFAHAFGVLAKLPRKEVERKVENLESLGWSKEQVVSAFRRHPYLISASTDKVRRSMEFFREELGWDAAYVAAYPVLLSFSFEKRILPRFGVIKILRSEELFDGPVCARHMMMGKAQFLEKFVTEYQDRVPGVLDAIQEKIQTQD